MPGTGQVHEMPDPIAPAPRERPLLLSEGYEKCVNQPVAADCRRLTRKTEPPILSFARLQYLSVVTLAIWRRILMRVTSIGRGLALGLLLAAGATTATAAPYLLVSGRWDNTIVVVDLAKAIEPANDGTENAIVNRVRVTPDIAPNAPASGQPVNVVLSPDRRFAYIVNHSGSVTTKAAADFQHGHPGTVTVLNVAKALDPANSMTLNGVEAIIPTGNFGPVGFAVTTDGRHALVSGSEGDGDEDGGRVITVVDLTARKVLHHIELAWGKPGFPCPPSPIPHAGPNLAFGCFTDTNGIVISPRHGGVAFSANGGTHDVSVIDVTKALANAPGAEIGRIPVGTGPWGIAVSPNGAWVATANRESARVDAEGNHVSLINVDKAVTGAKDAEAARFIVGTNNPSAASRPFGVAFTPDGKTLLVSNFRANNLSFVDVEKALAGELGAEVARLALATPDGRPSRPRGIVITPDGKYAAITGAPRGQPNSGVLWVVDIAERKTVGRVSGVGNETYLLALLP
jgi:DNA-binding beta-propeller fold protein YncE